MTACLAHRVFAHIELDSSGCWLWTGAIDAQTGYGRVGVGRQSLGAHRVAYELLVGSVPGGLQLDHLCRIRHCVNPRHLEPVTARENLLRGETLTAAHAGRLDCGHTGCRSCARFRKVA